MKMLTRFQIVVGLYHWLTCIFIIGLVCSQLLGAIWNSITTHEHVIYGRSPLLGPSQIVGNNDVPYADRVIACVGGGRFYEPKLVSALLANPAESAILEDSTGTAMHGYRLKPRQSGSVSDALDSVAQSVYVKSCGLIAKTIENIFAGCIALGYTNLTRDNLRVLDDWDSKNLYVLPHTLPILIMPYWDNAIYARHAIPTWGGDACIFRLEDAYSDDSGGIAMASFRGVNQSVRHERTLQWLDRPGGYWKNGWYEDQEGMRWYSDVVSSAKGPPYYMMHRVFDMHTGKELDCSNEIDCEAAAASEWWGDKFSSSSRSHKANSVYIANATEYGFFIYEGDEIRTVQSVFDWETLLSNVYTGQIKSRRLCVAPRMTSLTDLNHARACMQELDRFSHSMGWAFKGLDGGDNRDLDSPQNDSDLSHTAFGATGDIPSDFVAPTTATSKSKLRQKTTSNKPRIYRKRATRPTASSSAKTHPGDGNQSSCSSLKSPLRRPKKPSGKSEKPNAEPVDFVYDINVRRKLREQLDAERMRVLHEATAREARLRAENKWVFDKRDTSPPRRKQAWQSSSSPRKKPPTASLHAAKSSTPHPCPHSQHTASSSSFSGQRCSAPSRRAASSSASSSSSSTCSSYSTPASHRHRSAPRPAPNDLDDVETAIRDFERRLETHWSLSLD
ncbi:uncharacterized protein IUM83_11675 [Phytophthora cinnamomi]|uniref:uncharacterized protein n=1 Tax=Phytophthora cinnamomi TaxID=4785 RepID=UPI0035596469|nr:hypothetical protein IUM83_11675 [Phytophthora cinnamomi]